MISSQKINVFISSRLCTEYRTIRNNIALKFKDNELFHLFVMAGSVCHFIMMYFFIARMPLL